MDNIANIKQEASIAGDESGRYIAELVRKMKTETTTSEYEVGNKTNIKEEGIIPDINLQNESVCYSTNVKREVNNETVTSDCNLELVKKMHIKKEPNEEYLHNKITIKEEVVSDEGLSNEEYLQSAAKNVIGDEDFKMSIKIECGMQDLTSQDDKNCFSLYLVKKIKKDTDVYNGEIPSVPESEESDSENGETTEDISAESTRLCEEIGGHDSLRSGLEEASSQGDAKTCEICGEIFAHKSALKKHQLIHEQNRAPKDGVNEQQLISTSQDTCAEEPPPYIKCEICQKCFTDLRSLKTHKLIHGKGTNTCDICDQSFKRPGFLKRHKLLHEIKKVYECDICKWRCNYRGNFRVHLLRHQRKKSYKCDICDKRFDVPRDLKTHKKRHEGKKPYTCDICHVRIADLTYLKKHKLSHEGKLPYQCDICDKSYNTLQDLQMHKLNLKDNQPYKCDICDAKFCTSGKIKKHKLIHDDRRQYRCHICDKRFIQLIYLKKHKLRHESEKTYACGICEKKFTVLLGLKKHICSREQLLLET